MFFYKFRCFLVIVLGIFFFGIAVTGCDRREDLPGYQQESQVIDEDALVNAWLEFAKTDEDNLDIDAVHGIAERLSRSSGGIIPLLELLEDSEQEPLTKVLVVISVTQFINESHQAYLITLTEDTHEQTTRSCAANLLGNIETPGAQECLRNLMLNEEDFTVQVAATLALMKRDKDALERAIALWDDPRITVDQRTQIIYLIPNRSVFDYLHVFKDAVLIPEIDFSARMRSLSVLGQADDPSAVHVIHQVANDGTVEDEIRTTALRILAAQIERFTGTPQTTPEIQEAETSDDTGETTTSDNVNDNGNDNGDDDVNP